jgi:hypothetical protein
LYLKNISVKEISEMTKLSDMPNIGKELEKQLN